MIFFKKKKIVVGFYPSFTLFMFSYINYFIFIFCCFYDFQFFLLVSSRLYIYYVWSYVLLSSLLAFLSYLSLFSDATSCSILFSKLILLSGF
jgi:hypothetical protein